MKKTKKLLQTPEAKKRRLNYKVRKAAKLPAIPVGVRPVSRGNRFYDRLGVKTTITAEPEQDTRSSASFITGMVVFGFAIFCYTAYKFGELTLTPCVCP